MVKRQLSLTLVLLLGVTACVSQPTTKAGAISSPGATPSPDATTRPTASPSSTVPAFHLSTGPRASQSESSGPASSASPTKAGSSASPTSSPTYTRVTLKVAIKPCVQPGHSQTLSFHTRPKMGVVVNTRYADDKDGQAHGGFDYNHSTDAQGNYSLTWIIDPTTPIGPADSLVGTADSQGTGYGRGDFRVAAAC